jgi:AcrR family transcriptional regulator
MKTTAPLARRDRILDAAESSFAESGYAGASLRDIVLAAKVNLATVYYYFGSKTGLMEAVLKRRLDPLRQEHLQLLRNAQREAGGAPLPVARILEAMLLPPLQLAACDSTRRQAVMRLIGRIVSESSEQIQQILHGQRAEVRQAFLLALEQSRPEATRSELLWRMELVWGALAFLLCNPKRLEHDTRGECKLSDATGALAEMIRFFEPGFQDRPRKRANRPLPSPSNERSRSARAARSRKSNTR